MAEEENYRKKRGDLMVRAYRANVNSRCILVYGGKQYPVTLENISSDGALLTIESVKLPKLKTNEICNVMLRNNPDLRSSKNTCRIVRFDVHRKHTVAVQFLEPLENSGEPPPYNHQHRLLAIYKGNYSAHEK